MVQQTRKLRRQVGITLHPAVQETLDRMAQDRLTSRSQVLQDLILDYCRQNNIKVNIKD